MRTFYKILHMLTGKLKELPPGYYKAKIDNVLIDDNKNITIILRDIEKIKQKKDKSNAKSL